MILGGGSPKNFMLQTEPQIQEVLGIDEKGHDFFLQITDARPDTGGLSGATPAEAVSWGKIDPDKLPDAVVCYVDSTIALPLLTSYALAKRKPRKLKRLLDRREANMARLRSEFEQAGGEPLSIREDQRDTFATLIAPKGWTPRPPPSTMNEAPRRPALMAGRSHFTLCVGP